MARRGKTERVGARGSARGVRLHVGTSGYAYKEWKGSIYPKDLPAKGVLRSYGEHFRTVEINYSFYRMPRASVLDAYAGEVPTGFTFTLKAPQLITHFRRLRAVERPVSDFLRVAGALGKRLGPLLFQLPPNMKKDAEELREFLGLLPRDRRAAIEFRHASWFDDEVFGLLRERGAALCIADAEDDLEVPSVATADWGFLRLRRTDYGAKALRAWVERVRGQRWRDAFVYFKHEDEGKGPKLARKFLELAGVDRS